MELEPQYINYTASSVPSISWTAQDSRLLRN